MSTSSMQEPVSGLTLALEHVFDIRIDFHQRLIFDAMPGGQKAAYTSVKSGTVTGPRSAAESARSPANPATTGYFRCTPYFRAPEGPHGWLNRTVIVGGGERHTAPDHTLFRYYAAL
jgi:hypothetical protein